MYKWIIMEWYDKNEHSHPRYKSYCSWTCWPCCRIMLRAVAQHKPSNDIMWFMDNAQAHTRKASKAFLSSKDINACNNWPPNSPDLNPIQNVWAVMKQQVYSRHYNSYTELTAAVEKAWQGLLGSYLKTLMASFSSRKASVCWQVVAMKGTEWCASTHGRVPMEAVHAVQFQVVWFVMFCHICDVASTSSMPYAYTTEIDEQSLQVATL